MRTHRDDSGSERTCIVSGAKGAPEAMLRFVVAPDGSVVPDIRRKLPGRGVWTRLSAEAVRLAAQKQAFSRAFRLRADAPATLSADVDGLLEQDALQSLSMANKAGLVATGAFKTESAIENGDVAGLIEAGDGAPDGARKLARALHAKFGESAATIPVVDAFSSEHLGLALGKANVIHAALKSGAPTSAFLARVERLRRYRESGQDPKPLTSGGAPRRSGPLGRRQELAGRPSD